VISKNAGRFLNQIRNPVPSTAPMVNRFSM
jgi:hypothetical protein